MADQDGEEARGPDRPEPAYRKKLRTMDPDLTIICRHGDGDNVKEKSFQCHSAFLTMYSSYFDALLSSKMSESVTKQVTLEDVDPDIFDMALTLHEVPNQDKIKLKDLLKVAKFYYRFQFHKVMPTVEPRIDEFLSKEWPESVYKLPDRYDDRDYDGEHEHQICSCFYYPKKSDADLELLIEASHLVECLSLQSLYEKVDHAIIAELCGDSILGRGRLRLDHLIRLQPILAARPDRLKEHLDFDFPKYDKPSIESKDFPKFFHDMCADCASAAVMMDRDLQVTFQFQIIRTIDDRCVSRESREVTLNESGFGTIELELTGSDLRGFHSIRAIRYGKIFTKFRQCQHPQLKGSDWFLHIVDRDRKHFGAFFPDSRGHILPPIHAPGWISLGFIHQGVVYNPEDESEFVPPIQEAPDIYTVSVQKVDHTL